MADGEICFIDRLNTARLELKDAPDHVRLILEKQGKVVLPGIRELCRMYETRLGRFHEIESIEQKSAAIKSAKANKTGKQTKAAVQSGTLIVALDEQGRTWTSKDLAAKLQSWVDDPRIKSVRFVVGDAHGLSPEIRSTADLTWALSPLTLQGDLAWLMLWEQIYRAVTLNHGIPYHHE